MNPFQAIMGRMVQNDAPAPQIPASAPPMQNDSTQNWNAYMGQLQANPSNALRQAGYNVPEELSGNPQAMVMHLMRSGQIGGPMMQKIQPYLQQMGFR